MARFAPSPQHIRLLRMRRTGRAYGHRTLTAASGRIRAPSFDEGTAMMMRPLLGQPKTPKTSTSASNARLLLELLSQIHVELQRVLQ